MAKQKATEYDFSDILTPKEEYDFSEILAPKVKPDPNSEFSPEKTTPLMLTEYQGLFLPETEAVTATAPRIPMTPGGLSARNRILAEEAYKQHIAEAPPSIKEGGVEQTIAKAPGQISEWVGDPKELPGAIGRGLAEGLTVEIPRMAGQAAQYLGANVQGVNPVIAAAGMAGGHKVQQWAEQAEKAALGERPEYKGLAGVAYEGSKMLAPSIIPAGTAGAAARIGLAGLKSLNAAQKAKIATNIASLTSAGFYGTSTAQDVRARAKEKGVDPGLHPEIQGAIEALGEYVGTRYMAKLLGLDENAIRVTLENFIKTLGVENTTEFVQQLGQSLSDKYSGIRPDARPMDEAIQVIGPTTFMTVMTAGAGKAAEFATRIPEGRRGLPGTTGREFADIPTDTKTEGLDFSDILGAPDKDVVQGEATSDKNVVTPEKKPSESSVEAPQSEELAPEGTQTPPEKETPQIANLEEAKKLTEIETDAGLREADEPLTREQKRALIDAGFTVKELKKMPPKEAKKVLGEEEVATEKPAEEEQAGAEQPSDVVAEGEEIKPLQQKELNFADKIADSMRRQRADAERFLQSKGLTKDFLPTSLQERKKLEDEYGEWLKANKTLPTYEGWERDYPELAKSQQREEQKTPAVQEKRTEVESEQKPAWEIAEERVRPYAKNLRNLSDKELRAEDKKISDAINEWARNTPSFLPDGTLNPKIGRDMAYFELSAKLEAIGKEQDKRKGTAPKQPKPTDHAKELMSKAADMTSREFGIDQAKELNDVSLGNIAQSEHRNLVEKAAKQGIIGKGISEYPDLASNYGEPTATPKTPKGEKKKSGGKEAPAPLTQSKLEEAAEAKRESRPPRPLVNPKASALKQDQQLRAQQEWDKKYGEEKRTYPMSGKDRRREVLQNRLERGEEVPQKLLEEFKGEEWVKPSFSDFLQQKVDKAKAEGKFTGVFAGRALAAEARKEYDALYPKNKQQPPDALRQLTEEDELNKPNLSAYKSVEELSRDYEILYHGGSKNIIGNKLVTGGRVVGEVTKENLGKGQDYGGIFFTPEKELARTFARHTPAGDEGGVHTFLVKKSNLFDETNPKHRARLRQFIGKKYQNVDGEMETFTQQMHDFIFPQLEDGRRHMDWATFDPQVLEAIGFDGAKVIENYSEDGKHLYSTVLFRGGQSSPHWLVEHGATLKDVFERGNSILRKIDSGRGSGGISTLLSTLTPEARENVVVTTRDNAPEGLHKFLDNKTKGIYYNGKVYLFENADARTFFHEIRGHYNLRQMFGMRLDPFLDKLWNDRERAIKNAEWYNRYTRTDPDVYNPNTAQGKRNLANEYIAHLSENQDRTTWEKLIAWLRSALRNIAPNLTWTDAELKKLIADGYRKMQKTPQKGTAVQQAPIFRMDKPLFQLKDRKFVAVGIKIGDKVYRGNRGEIHADLLPRMTQDEQFKYLDNTDSHNKLDGFIDDSGQFVSRQEASREAKRELVSPDVLRQIEGKITDNPAFKKWFGDSKVVDENGEPLVVYHGTWRSFDEFNRNEAQQISRNAETELGFHFGTPLQADERVFRGEGFDLSRDQMLRNMTGFAGSKDNAAQIMPVYLKIENPLRLPDQGNWEVNDVMDAISDQLPMKNAEQFRELFDKNFFDTEKRGEEREYESIRKSLEQLGYDGIIYKNYFEGEPLDSYIAFSPTQIKSATGNRGTFDPTDPNILRQIGEESDSETLNRLKPIIEATGGYNVRVDSQMGRPVVYFEHKGVKDAEGKSVPTTFARFPETVDTPEKINAIVEEKNADYQVLRQLDEGIDEPMGDVTSSQAQENYDRIKRNLDSVKVKILEKLQDNWVRVDKLLQDREVVVTDENNPYQQKVLYAGRVQDRMDKIQNELDSIDKAVLKTAKERGLSSEELWNDINLYLHAKHAPERNAVHGERASGMSDEDAQDVMGELQEKGEFPDIQRLGDQLAQASRKGLEILRNAQLISEEKHSKLRELYPNHVPLNRVMDDTGIEHYIAGGEGFNVYSSGLKRAKGSERQVADIAVNIATNLATFSVRAEKNLVDLATLQFARDNAHLGLFEEIKPKAIGKRWDGSIIFQEIRDPLVLHLYENGKPVYLRIKDASLARAFQNINIEKLHPLFHYVAAFGRLYSGLATRFNPEFWPSNKIRDLEELLPTIAAAKGLGGKAALKAVGRDILMENVKAVSDYVRGKDTEGARLYAQMKADGGTTGGLALSTRKDIEINLEKLKRLNRSGGRRALNYAIQTVDHLNQIFEDSTRLSVYRTALEMGMTRKQAAFHAKNSTIDFNRKGEWGGIINALYIFSNASIQGSVKMLRAMKNPKVATAVTLAVATAVFLTAQWNDEIDEDWRDKVSKWDRLNGLPILIPSDEGVRYITIPVSWGLKPIKAMVDNIYDLSTGNEESVKDAVGSVLTSVIDAYNPLGGSDVVSAITPTVLDLPVDLARNKTWSGSMIRPHDYGMRPRYTLYFKSLEKSAVGQGAIATARRLDDIGIEVSPADIKYVFDQATGGTGRFLSKVITSAASAVTGELPTSREAPFAGRFYRDIPTEELGARRPVLQRITEQEKRVTRLKIRALETGSQPDIDAYTAAKRVLDDMRKASPEYQAKLRVEKDQREARERTLRSGI